MSTTETNGRPADGPHHCAHCGTSLAGGRFCPGCGKPVAQTDTAAIAAQLDPAGEAAATSDPVTGQLWTRGATRTDDSVEPPTQVANGSPGPAPDSSPPLETESRSGEPGISATEADTRGASAPTAAQVPMTTSPPRRSSRRGLFVGIALAAILLAGAAVAAVLLLGGGDDGPSPGTVYRQQAAKAFGPVLGANKQLSDELASLRGTKATRARLAVRRAQEATTAATGAIGALTAPPEEAQLASNTRQVLDRENAYLSAVSSVLANPSDSRRSQLVTLSSNLTSAFSAAGPTVSGTSGTVSGADRVTSWAQRAARTLKDRESRKKRSRPEPSPPRTPVPFSGGQACGGGVYAGPNTSCSFAFNVKQAYYDVPGNVATLRVFSPVTGETYTMDCAPTSAGVTCSGGNNASVAF